ncbi:hypothetical protein BT96DRAFT_988786 [Gymnopus androsaceus JB14]|uniref:Stress-response A/B barrel domain-containing protein n=1 Tax=Gymnopus androsaceus JB14 TaxID=1447944 RepID=A0A6A4I4U1_9AGAR|nr:hypothetical protein BT96DRAFT_988786 [Gymnopus androsaceus JB14]
MPTVTRFVALKYKPGASSSEEQKRQVVDGLVEMYKHSAHKVIEMPVGGRNINHEGHHKGFDFAFIVEFKSVEARDEFIPDEHYNSFKVTSYCTRTCAYTDPFPRRASRVSSVLEMGAKIGYNQKNMPFAIHSTSANTSLGRWEISTAERAGLCEPKTSA